MAASVEPVRIHGLGRSHLAVFTKGITSTWEIIPCLYPAVATGSIRCKLCCMHAQAEGNTTLSLYVVRACWDCSLLGRRLAVPMHVSRDGRPILGTACGHDGWSCCMLSVSAWLCCVLCVLLPCFCMAHCATQVRGSRCYCASHSSS